MTTAVDSRVRTIAIDLESGDTPRPICRSLPAAEYGDTFYTSPREPLSVVDLPPKGSDFEFRCSRVVRQNARVAERAGYTFQQIDRADWEDDLFALRSSTPERQGRPMDPSYMRRQSYSSDRLPDDRCRRHLIAVHGVVSPDGHLVAYAQVVQCGDVARFNTILGHADHLEARVVWLLTLRLIQWHIDECGARFALYYAHASGRGDGLRYFKERFGFRPTNVLWRFDTKC